MPFGDRTGPGGMGPGTGRGMGYCHGFPWPGYFSRPGWGFFGRCGGWGWRHWFHATGLPGWLRATPGWPWCGPPATAPSPEQELGFLKRQAQFFERALENIRKRIEELSAKAEEG